MKILKKKTEKLAKKKLKISESPEISEKSEKKTAKKKKSVALRKPGRPRMHPIRKPRPRNGIVCAPKDVQNFVEFLYDKPLIFKKIWNYFKLMAVNKIQIIFRVSEIILWCEDHHKKSKMRICIDATSVNHYYCTKTLDLGMSCKNPELIMSTIDKTYISILFLSKVGYTQKDIRIILKNEIEIDESHKIELIGEYDKISNENEYLDTDYTIKFELPGKYFKKMISDIRAFSDQITIRQDGPSDPLIFEYVKPDKKITSYHIVRNNESIKFESKLKEDDTFRVSFKIDYVKPVSSALLSDKVVIYAHENKPLMFSVFMDKSTVNIKILTNIIDNREM